VERLDVTLGAEQGAKLARLADALQQLGDRLSSAWTLTRVHEDVDVRCGPLQLAGLDREQSHHQAANEAPTRLLMVEGARDPGDGAPERYRVGIADVDNDRRLRIRRCAQRSPLRAASSWARTSAPMLADDGSGPHGVVSAQETRSGAASMVGIDTVRHALDPSRRTDEPKERPCTTSRL
jgi:hypothetical protein